MKTKPTQHSVKELREIGIQPDIVLCRADRPVPEGDRRKIALFTNVAAGSGDSGARRRLDLQDSRRCCTPRASTRSSASKLATQPAAGRPCRSGTELVDALEHPRARGRHRDGRQVRRPDRVVQVAVRGADPRRHPHAQPRSTSTTSTPRRSRATASRRCAAWTRSSCRAASASAASKARSRRSGYARENGIPYLGICLGMQLAVIEYARHMAGLDGANSTEFDPETPHPVVALITEWQNRDGSIEKRTRKSDLGGTMRLGAQPCDVRAGIARAPHLRRDHGGRAPSPSLRGQQPLPAAARGGRARGRRAREQRHRRRSGAR